MQAAKMTSLFFRRLPVDDNENDVSERDVSETARQIFESVDKAVVSLAGEPVSRIKLA